MKTMLTPVDAPNLWFALKVLRYAYPTIVFFYFFIALGITACYMQAEKSRVRDQYVRRGMILCLIASLTGTYAVEIVVTIIKSLVEGWNPQQDHVVYLISSTLVFLVEIIALADTLSPTWYPYYGTWFIGLFVEICLIIFPNLLSSPTNSAFDYVLIAIQATRILNFVALPIVYFYFRSDDKAHDTNDAERQSLLHKNTVPSSSESSTLNGNGYGTTDDTTSQGAQGADVSDAASVTSEDSYLEQQRKSKEAIAKRLQEDGNWWTYIKGFSMFVPFIWPVSDRKLQFRAVLVGIVLLVSNAFNVLVPIQFGVMVQSLITYTGGNHSHNIWTPVLLYSLLRFINDGSCLTVIRTWLWTPLEQYAYSTLSSAAHRHIMSLSSDFHDSKSSSDLFQVVNGGRSVADLMEMLCFQVIPMLIDLVIAFIYFGAFGPYMFLVLVVTFLSYMYATVKLISMRANQRRQYIILYRKEWTVGQESLDGWTTANLFNMVPYENERYSGVVKEHIDSKWTYEWFSYITAMAKSLIMCFGLTGVLCLGAYSVVYEGQTVGKFTTLLMFWGQLQSPLSFLASAYRSISSSLMDAERLLELFKTEPSIKDTPGAKELKVTKCEIEFSDVCFSYDERKATLKNVSFFAEGGKTIAFVGETGGGKSTMLKLMDRFYDVKSGSIKIDGQDIRDITMHSLRSHIGVVPQDPTLFNDTIMNNLRYARLDATDEEVYEACKAAAVHDKIMKFADGYNSKVGDRGVKLSGGEKQRVAIARAILKRPKIILLDEATSAVDTETEQKIQEGFRALCRGRTTFVVAHRLSTVMNADHIVVIMDGRIVEQGSHDELFHSKGKYADLWAKQIFVKPSDRKSRSRSRSKSPAKKDASIINALTTQKETVDLAKAAKGIEDHHHGQDDGKDHKGGMSSNGQPKDEPKRKSEALKPAPLVLKANPSRFRVSSLNGPKLPSHKLDLKIPPLGSIAQAKQNALSNSLRPTPNLAHRPATIPNPTVVTPHPATITPHPATVTPHPAAVTPHPATVTPHPTTVAPNLAATRSYSPQRKIATAQSIEQQPCKVHPIGSPTRPPILSQPRSLFYTGNLPVPIHAKNVLEQPNPWVDEQHCRSASSTQSMLVSADLRHEKIHDECKAGSGKTEGNVHDKVGKLDKGSSKGLPRGAMFIQLPKQMNSSVEKEKGNEFAVSTAQNSTVASELTPLLGLKDSPILTSPTSAGLWKESKDVTKDQKRYAAKERRKAASSSKTISEPVAVMSQLPNLDVITSQPTGPVQIKTKEAIKEQRKRDKEERKAESLRKRGESLKKKAEKKLKRQGLGAVIAAGDEEEMGSYGAVTTDIATASSTTSVSPIEGDMILGFTGGTDGIIETDTDVQSPVQSEMGTKNIAISTLAQLAADSLYPQRNRRHDSKSEPRGFSVSFDLDGAGSQGSQADTVVIHGDGSNGGSEENMGTLVQFSQVSEGSKVGIAKIGERKGILKNFAHEKRRVSAPARECVIHDGQKRRERIPTPMAMVGGLVGSGLGGLEVGVPTMPELEREKMGPPVSMNMQAAQAENGMSGGRKMYMGGGLMRGKRRQWKIRSRAAGSTSAQCNGSLNDNGSMGMDGAGGGQGGNEVGERSGVGKGKEKGKGKGSVRFADEA
ncbi:hypothetical protein EYC80_009920 [Monilinia laxa]|uniref:Uncharacterized protein n=1 Tax=Monilinia laxa TaxID=61186 RepID=A0A5N6JR24_MONLA|nr:hypothetical protein EYC80_009920 [Monilinia laxa]